MYISISVDGLNEFVRNLRIKSEGIREGLEEVHGTIVDVVKDRTDELFEKEGSDVQNGPPWKPLSASTELSRKKRTGYYRNEPDNPGVLRWTGRLQNSAVKTKSKKQGTLEYTAPYAKYHQRGGGRLPRRKIIDLDTKTNEKIVKAIQKVINDNLGNFGRQL